MLAHLKVSFTDFSASEIIVFLSATVMKKDGTPTEIAGFPALAKPIGLTELVNAIEANLSAPVAS